MYSRKLREIKITKEKKMRYLVLKFEGAKKFVDQDDKYVRFNVPCDTLHVDNVYNCLAVLFGERPVSKREAKNGQMKLNKVDSIFKLANDSMVKISSDNVINNTKTGNVYPRTEKLFATRFTEKNNSLFPPEFDILIDGERRGIKSLVPSWFIMEKFLSADQLDSFVQHVCRVSNNKIEDVRKMKMVKIFEIANANMDEQFEDFLILLKKIGKTPLYNLLCGSKKENREPNWYLKSSLAWCKSSLWFKHASMVRGEPESYVCVSGVIYVPYQEDMSELLCRGSMMSNILDSGLVTVHGVEDVDVTTVDVKPVYKGV